MKDEKIKNIIVAIIILIGWTVLSKYIGFERTVLMALAIIYATQR